MHNAVLQVPSDQIVPCSQAGMSDITEVVQGDFCKMPFGDNSFDAVFSVEATCHAGEVCFLALQNFHLPHQRACLRMWLQHSGHVASNTPAQ
jgi:Methyltransferase domain